LIRRATRALANHLLHALAIPPQKVVVVVDHRQQLLDRAALGAGRRRAVVDPVLLSQTIEQSDIAQEFEVPRDTRLALADHLTDLTDGQLGAGKQREQPKARGLGGRTQC
jgi:hypothetical protein